jgi:hypothetical protein
MIKVPPEIGTTYASHLRRCGLPGATAQDYMKWLRFFLDYCEKYQMSGGPGEQTGGFLKKLRQKHQSELQVREAAHAVSLYFQALGGAPLSPVGSGANESLAAPAGPVAPPFETEPATPPLTPADGVPHREQTLPRYSQYRDAGYQVTSASPEWDAVLSRMADEIKVRHYSRKTLRTYALWSR